MVSVGGFRKAFLLTASAAGCFVQPLAVGADESAIPHFDLEPAVRAATAMPRLHSLLVSRDGELVLERYFNGADATELSNVKSVSKSVISALVGIAIERGHIEGVDQPIGDYFSDFFSAGAGAADVEAAKRQITVQNLLTMQSGLETTSNRNYGAWVLSSNWVEYALRQPIEHPPGTRMVYSTGNTHLLSAMLTEATGQSTLELAREALAAPLGFRLAPWPRDPQGIYFGGNDMEMTPRQMLAFGELYLNEGRASGVQVIPAAWIEASLESRAESTREEGRYYGYGWWIRDMAGFRATYAWGYGGQFILLVPELALVVVTTSDSTPGADRRAQTRRLYRLIEYSIVEPAFRAL
jgi:CubicO group peptidase (beta-lactamase class C family)